LHEAIDGARDDAACDVPDAGTKRRGEEDHGLGVGTSEQHWPRRGNPVRPDDCAEDDDEAKQLDEHGARSLGSFAAHEQRARMG
jgi:hypothetical protein